MMAEARLLRQHKGRLEARMQILEEHNRQLEAQLQRLRRLLDEVTDYSFSITYCKFHCQTNNLSYKLKYFTLFFTYFCTACSRIPSGSYWHSPDQVGHGVTARYRLAGQDA